MRGPVRAVVPHLPLLLAQVLSSSSQEQAEFFFDLYDLDGSGTMDRNEVGEAAPPRV